MKKANENKSGGARLKILGTGCSKCKSLYENTILAVKEIGLNTDIEKVEDLVSIASYGVMSTPALVFDGKVISYGKVLNKEEIIALIK